MSWKLRSCSRCGGDICNDECLQCGRETIQPTAHELLVDAQVEFMNMIATNDEEEFDRKYKRFLKETA